jgi:hypothetical protein
MTKGNQLQLFYHNGTKYVAFGHATANSLQVSNETQTVSSKDMGLHPLVETTGSNWSCSGSMLFTTDNAAKVMGMAQTGQQYTVAFATISEANWQDGLKSVTDISTNISWSVGSGFVRYGDAIVTSASITANDGETCTMDVEFTGSGRLLDTAPATPKSYT